MSNQCLGQSHRRNMNTANNLVIRQFQLSDKNAVIDLWQRCNLVVPWNDPDKDILTKMSFQPDLPDR